jgi:Xaa-Pro dipeptidase
MHQLRERVDRVFSEAADAEAVFVYNQAHIDLNFLYVTGMEGGVFENCGVLIDRQGQVTVFTSALEEEMLSSLGEAGEVLVYRSGNERNNMLRSRLSEYQAVGMCFSSITHGFFARVEEMLDETMLIDVTDAFARARMVKFESEIEVISRAADLVSRVAGQLPGLLRHGITEREIAAEIDCMMLREGAQGPSFQTIVAFGPNSSKPHHQSGDARLEKGQVVLADFGAMVGGYAADITRTWLTGSDESALHLYSTVLEAQQKALDMIGPGVTVSEVDETVRGFIDSFDRYRGRFIHRLGHSIGLSVHDDSYPGEAYEHRFQPGMVLTVEPGVYLPGSMGVRIEDDIVVDREGIRVLTSASKNPEILEI